jgi:hypothetical protein
VFTQHSPMSVANVSSACAILNLHSKVVRNHNMYGAYAECSRILRDALH